jgi:antitoxin VapB
MRAARRWYILNEIVYKDPAMPLSIRNAKAEALARDVAARTGETMTEAIVVALEERLARLRSRRETTVAARQLLRIARRIKRRRTRDRRTPEAILGYDKHGLPR